VPSRVSGMMGLIAWTMAVLLLMGNLGYYSRLLLTHRQEPDLWAGPLMPGKRYNLPDISQARVIKGGEKKEVIEAKVPEEVKRLESLPVEPEKKEEKQAAPPPPVPPPALEARVVAAAEGVPKVDEDRGRYIVQAGSFVLEMGMEGLVTRMRENGMQPKTGIREESVRLNNVQAGPFGTLEEAKVVETVLKSNGYDVEVEETWEGYILSLSRSLLLSFAIHDMEKAQTLGIKPLRMVKIEADMPVRKVFFGPYASKEEARRMSERVAQLGLAVPVIKAWEPGSMGQVERE